MNTKKIYIISSIIVAIGIAAGISFFLIRDQMAKIPDDIKLVTQNDEVYDFAKSDKKLKLVEFAYTYCPEICPTTTQKMNLLKNDLEKAGVYGKKIQFLTVSIDPYRDTPEELRKYMKNYNIEDDGNWILLTGDRDHIRRDIKQIRRVGEPFQFQFRDPGDGFYIHTTFVYLVDEENKYIKKFPMGDDFDKKEVYEKIMDKID
ncbi:SCO family protein [Bacillus massilinigeriensis]|uniref:SCO family protein n=1 Tax=Bacillus massilionigeriensis TaxID=1805475 RepID=UPI00096AE2B9|nr:SCO family protein [Bacillus massilionigeriensis]